MARKPKVPETRFTPRNRLGYTTRSGLPARILTYDRQHESFPIMALYMRDGIEAALFLTAKGTTSNDGVPTDLDLIDIERAPTKHKGSLVFVTGPDNKIEALYFESMAESFSMVDAADENQLKVLAVTAVEFTEGEGLD